MNERAAAALYEAERKGVRQIVGDYYGPDGSMCAMGVLSDEDADESVLVPCRPTCPMCGSIRRPGWGVHMRFESEAALVVHLNDDHRLTFSEIARKLGPDSA